MRVLLLGPVRAEADDGAAVALGGPKQRAVFTALALNAGRVVSLDRLISELWSDEPPARATMALQSIVSRLRRILAAVPSDGLPPARIVTRPPGWVLELPPENVDAVEFSALAREGADLLAAGRPQAAAQRLRQALDLWTDPALGGLDPGQLPWNEGSRLEQLRLDTTEVLLSADLAAGQDLRVAEESLRFVTENPFRERGWLALMLALYRSGRQADALAAAARLRAVLSEELGLDPSLEVRELEAAILRQDPSLHSGPRGRVGVPESSDVRLGGGGRSAGDSAAPIAGRDDVLAILDEVLVQAGAGRGRAVLVEGSAGIGKSTILRALDGLSSAGGGRTLHGNGVASEAGAPALWPWVGILRELLAQFPDLVGSAATATLAQLDPALATDGSRPVQDGDPELGRTRLYRAVIDLLTLARQKAMLTVVVDDAQWLDDESSKLLSVAVPELTRRGVLFALGFRSDESTVVADVMGMLGSTPRDDVVRLRLRGLEDSEVAGVIRSISGADADPAVATAITRRTAGNPLFVTELTRLLVSEQRLDPVGVYAFLPAGTRDVLRRRLDRLPSGTIDVLVAAAFVAGPVDVDLLRQVTALQEDEVLDGCDGAVLTGFMIEDHEPGWFSLSHDLVRQTLVESVSTARRLRLHARVGHALEGWVHQRPEVVVEVARHVVAAASLVGPTEAIRCLVAASDYELAGLFFHRAREELEAALALAAQIPGSDARAAVSRPVRDRLALLSLYTSGPAPQGPGSSGSAPTTTFPPLDVHDPTAWYVAMFSAIICGDYTRAMAAARELDSGRLPLPVAALVRWTYGLAAFELGHVELAEQQLTLADDFLEDGDQLGVAELFSFSTSVPMFLALIAHFRGDEADADRCQRRAQVRAARSSADVVALDFSSAWLAASRGDLAAAAEAAAACVQHAQQADYPTFATMGRVVSGWAAAMKGDAAGLGRMDEGYALHLSDGRRMHAPVLLVLRAEAHAHQGHLDVARDLVTEARDLALVTGEHVLGPRLGALADRLARVVG
ncbi:MAG: hypothetical protein QOF53_303 [Nocardioidaceae bacterium]|nr:hypothetical protein [Nocardioidaceae bacterium]